MLAGMLCCAIPFFLFLFHTTRRMQKTERELRSYQELEQTYHSASLWVLNTPLNAGDIIQEEHCTNVIVKTQDAAQLSLLESCSSLKGLSAKTSLQKGTLLTKDMFYDANAHEENYQLFEITDLTLPFWVSKNDFIDIRIRFPNGEDYIVISHQKVQQLLSDENAVFGMQLELSEEAILRLSSARYDREQYNGCEIYITKYVWDFQESTTKDYPVNPDVFTLMEWNPNITTLYAVEKEQEKRNLLESHLKEFFLKGTSDGGNSSASSSSSDETSFDENSDADGTDDSLTVYHP